MLFLKSMRVVATMLVCFLGCLLWTSQARADTYYRVDTPPTVADGDFQQINSKITIEGTTTSTFTGDSRKDRAEFRLPSGFYITTAGTVDNIDDAPGFDIAVRVAQGLEGKSKDVVDINLIDPSSSNPNHYRGFELVVKKSSASSTSLPQLVLYINKIYVPRGASGNVVLRVDRSGNSGFSSGNLTVAQVASQRLDISSEKTPFLTSGSQTVGPILVTENMPGAFKYIELTLPAGYSWIPDTATINPGLGLTRDYDGSNGNERDYTTAYFDEKRYGQSVLRVELTGADSVVAGTLRIECGVDVDEGKAAAGSIIATVEGSAKPSAKTLTIGNFSEQKATVTADSPKALYGGLLGQEIADITISELVPGTLTGERKVTLALPSWAKWDVYPTVQVQGVTELSIITGQDEKATPMGSDGNMAQFVIDRPSQNDAGKIIIKDAKVNVQVDAPAGDLKVNLLGSAGVTGDATVGTVKPPLTITAKSNPSLVHGRLNQQAGDIDITEAAGRVFLAQQIWVDFPDRVSLSSTPQVKITSGNLTIAQVYLTGEREKRRLVIPIEMASTTPGTISITDIFYDVGNLAADGDVVIHVGGPAVNEVNHGSFPLFVAHDWAGSVVNANIQAKTTPPPDGATGDQKLEDMIGESDLVKEPGTPGNGNAEADTPGAPTPVTQARNILFFLGNETYRVNGQTYQMDVSPYMDNDRVFIPLRYAGMALGIQPQNILWDGEKQAAALYNQNTLIRVNLGENALYRFETKIESDAAAHLYSGRIMVPIRALATAFGANVEWDAGNQMVKITTNS